jgi:hypothetical protein
MHSWGYPAVLRHGAVLIRIVLVQHLAFAAIFGVIFADVMFIIRRHRRGFAVVAAAGGGKRITQNEFTDKAWQAIIAAPDTAKQARAWISTNILMSSGRKGLPTQRKQASTNLTAVFALHCTGLMRDLEFLWDGPCVRKPDTSL